MFINRKDLIIVLLKVNVHKLYVGNKSKIINENY